MLSPLSVSIYYTEQCFDCIFTAVKETVSFSLFPVLPGLLIVGDVQSAHDINKLLYVGKAGVFRKIQKCTQSIRPGYGAEGQVQR